MEIEFSRHAKRRMRLYGITKKEVKLVIEKSQKEDQSEERITYRIGKRFKYPIRVIALKKEYSFLVITVYPLKKGL